MQRWALWAGLGGASVLAAGVMLWLQLASPTPRDSKLEAPTTGQGGAVLLSLDPPLDRACEATPDCTRFGRCRSVHGACIAAHDEHCIQSSGCREEGACGVLGERCAPRLDAHCAASASCRTEGACALTGVRCLPAEARHCEASEGCLLEGRCYLARDERGVRCGVETHAECRASTLCHEQGRCRVAPLDFGGSGRCIAADLTPRERVRLRSARHGVDGELVLLVDGRAARHPSIDDGGYWPNPDDPLAAASLELSDRSGAVRDEITLFPDVVLTQEDLGTGTDTFLVTERVSCATRHWCGWTTLFLEVRDGRLVHLKARGERGEERPLAVTASQGSRWMLVRGTRPRQRDVLEQVEGPVPGAPALTETRFTYERGSFRFSERTWPDDRPTVVGQRGPWHGTLDFHAR